VNRKFKNLDHSSLLDQLAQHTAVYTRLLIESGSTDQKEACRQLIHRILAEINIRERERETKDPADRIIS
jgi:hypothetical protein